MKRLWAMVIEYFAMHYNPMLDNVIDWTIERGDEQ